MPGRRSVFISNALCSTALSSIVRHEAHMPSFKVKVNGKVACTAVLDGEGVLGAHISWVRRKGSRKPPQLSLHVGGLDSRSGDHLIWYEALPLHLGDEVRVRMVADRTGDPPAVRKRADPAADRRARESYVRNMAKELGWKLVIPK